MTLRRRLSLVAAAAVAIAIVLASLVVYVVVRGELRGRVDDELRASAARVPFLAARLDDGGSRPAVPPPGEAPGFPFAGGGSPLPPPRDALGLATAYIAVVGRDGTRVLPRGGAARLPVTATTRAVAAGAHAPFLADAVVGGTPVRVFTRAVPGVPGYAIQVARPLAEIDRTLHRLALLLLLVSAGGIALAATLGRLVARTALVPVARLTGTVEHVAQTSDLTRRIEIDPGREDEIARLARGVNVMLAALESSVGRQRQLVADASHELRTPLTSLRTNIDVLARASTMPETGNGRPRTLVDGGPLPQADALSDDERTRLLHDVVEQLDELGALVSDLVELARDEERPAEPEDLRFDELVTAAVERARRRAGAPLFALTAEPCLVRGVPMRLDRAVANLLDNAAKWSPPGAEVTVTLRDGALTVRDRGPGIAAEDSPHVFERFYRAPGARGMPGSGLGLAIVRQVAESHGGRVEAESAEGGGALLRLALPLETAPDRGPASVAMVDTDGD